MVLSISETLRYALDNGLLTEGEIRENMWMALGDFIDLSFPELYSANAPAADVITGLNAVSDDERIGLWVQLKSMLEQALDGKAIHHDEVTVLAGAVIATAELLKDRDVTDPNVAAFAQLVGCSPVEYLNQFKV